MSRRFWGPRARSPLKKVGSLSSRLFSNAINLALPISPPLPRPNILITGTPGTGKTSLCEELASTTGFTHINVGAWVKDKELHDGYDENMGCYVLDEDLLCDELEEALADGGVIVDYHSCDFFPERWFDLVVVLQCENGELWRRLEGRGYAEAKIRENVQCEIMMVVAEEAAESYKAEVVKYMRSDSVDDMERNADTLQDWIKDRARNGTASPASP